ncbi:hypothetical protein C8A05DRAFT_12864 [Staphylotrichum tortipilum]|uniref:Uncharacterized protein n=1 Tax=Staphylotrichum tortipilum TaxID=2831512 RepID=A0AAN6MTA1_9PEZI|nr:hypothetical protein C8A05DRAFT_12864 [Staphylotrichum longicolle]
MVRYALVAFAGLAAALPLNINLGAYSPALVVGDGEISFGGRQDVSSLISALEGAAVNAAAGAATRAAGAGTAAAAANVAAAASTAPTPVPVPNTVENAATADPVLTEQAQQIAGLQGLGKAIAPRVDDAETEKLGKRDLAGFDRALKFAEVALTKGPKIQLGTGAEGSGVGIIVENTPASGARAGAEKRDVTEATAPRRRTKVTTMYVRRGVPAALQNPTDAAAVVAREIAVPRATVDIPVTKRDVSTSAFDEVNLNVDGDAGVTMTFVESLDDDEDEDDE